MKTKTEMARTAFRYCGGIAALFILFSATLSAQQDAVNDQNYSSAEKPSIQVAFVQVDKDYLYFKLTVSKAENRRTWIRITDKRHEVDYSDSFLGDGFVKTLKVPKTGDATIDFIIYSGRESLRKSFEVRSKIQEVYSVSEAELNK